MSNKIMGKAQIKANGALQETLPGATLDIGGPSRTTVAGANAILGFTEAVAPSKIEFEIAVKGHTSLAAIRRWDDVTVTFEADTGQTWVVSHGWVTNPPTTTDNDGKAKVTIEGPPAEEMSS